MHKIKKDKAQIILEANKLISLEQNTEQTKANASI